MVTPYGNVVLHYRRYTTDKWLPNCEDAASYLSEEDKHGILVFKEKPHGCPSVATPSFPFSHEKMEHLRYSTAKYVNGRIMHVNQFL